VGEAFIEEDLPKNEVLSPRLVQPSYLQEGCSAGSAGRLLWAVVCRPAAVSPAQSSAGSPVARRDHAPRSRLSSSARFSQTSG